MSSKDFPEMDADDSFSQEYWLVPGLETVQGNLNVSVTVGGTPGTGSTQGDLMNTYSVNNTTYRNCPRSMAVAYSKIIIDGCSIHLTELSRSSPPLTQYVTDGWTNEVQVKVYGFCNINRNGLPDIGGGGFGL